MSVPTGVSVAEDGGTVRVCATLTLSPSAGTTIAADITITLATSNGEEENSEWVAQTDHGIAL